MGQIMAIGGREELYVFRLSEYLTTQTSLPFQIQAFYDYEKLIQYMERNKVSVLLLEEALFEPEKNKLKADQIILLSDQDPQIHFLQSQKEGDEKEEYPKIWKYQSAKTIAKQILSICTQTKGNLSIPKIRTRNVRLLGIYSPIGRCLQTSFSLVLGQLLSRSKKTLYINLEPYSGFQSLFGKRHERNMSDILYFYKKRHERFYFQLNSCIESFGKLDYIPPARSYIDLLSVDEESWIGFLEAIIAQTDYEYIILDLSDYVRGLIDILNSCDYIYTITKEDGIAKAKIEQYEQMLTFTNHEDLLQRIKKCNLPVFKELQKQLEELPYSELATYVQKLIEEDGL